MGDLDHKKLSVLDVGKRANLFSEGVNRCQGATEKKVKGGVHP